jgi:hypothetical protein
MNDFNINNIGNEKNKKVNIPTYPIYKREAIGQRPAVRLANCKIFGTPVEEEATRSKFNVFGGPEKGRFKRLVSKIWVSGWKLTSETVQGTSLPLQSVDDVHGGDGLPLGVFGVRDGITDYVFQKHLQHTTGFFVDQPRDTFYSTTAG